VLAGAVYCPAVDEIVVAALGEGCWWNDARCRVSKHTEIGRSTLLTTDIRFTGYPDRAAQWSALANEAAVARTWGDCYGYLMVATGRAELMVDNLMSPWDSAALIPVVREAGGEFSDWDGRITPFGNGAMASNGAMAAGLRARLGVPWPPTHEPTVSPNAAQA
jgi:fructose-1,6-bisphosphatase/inositol monophosphatase family enzyme